MKKVKKIIVSFLLMCMLCVGMTCVASATAAEFRFSDPQTSVGAEVEVTAKVSSAKALGHCRQALLQPGIWKRLIKMNLWNLGELQMENKEKKQMLTTELTKEKSGGSAGMIQDMSILK